MSTRTSTTRVDRLPLSALLLLAAVGFTAITTELLPSGLLPQIGQGFGVPESDVGYLTASYAAIIVVSVIPMSKLLLGRVARKTLLTSLVVAFAASNVLIALSPDLTLAVGARLIGGMAHGLLWSSMAPYVARIVPARMMGRAMAIVFSGNSIGLAVGAPTGTLLGSLLGWRMSFLLLAAVGGMLAVLALWLLPRVPLTRGAASPSLRQAAREPGVRAIATAWPLLLLAHFALFTYIAPFIREAGLPDTAVSLSLSIIGGAGLAGIWMAGLTADSRPRLALLITIGAIIAAFLLLPVVGTSLLGAVCLLAVWGAGLGAVGIFNQAAILRAGGEHRDAANGITVVTIQLGIAIGAVYGAVALTSVGALLIPLAAAVPAAAAFVITVAGRAAAYPPGPKEGRNRRGVSASGQQAGSGVGNDAGKTLGSDDQRTRTDGDERTAGSDDVACAGHRR